MKMLHLPRVLAFGPSGSMHARVERKFIGLLRGSPAQSLPIISVARRAFYRDATMRILLVEDERSAARMIAKGLREHGHAVDVVGDGASAVQQATMATYDVVI